jgi:quercetin 2,3-dioxygenase
MTTRAIHKAFLVVEQAEDVGVRVRRSIGGRQLRNFSPFLMLDHFSFSSDTRLSDHPHRGQGKPTNLNVSFFSSVLKQVI